MVVVTVRVTPRSLLPFVAGALRLSAHSCRNRSRRCSPSRACIAARALPRQAVLPIRGSVRTMVLVVGLPSAGRDGQHGFRAAIAAGAVPFPQGAMVQRLVAGGQFGGHPRGAQGLGGGPAQRPVAEPLADGRLGDAEARSAISW